MHLCLCAYKTCVEAPWKPEDDPASSGAAVVVIGDLPNAGAGNSTWVLYKSSSEESRGLPFLGHEDTWTAIPGPPEYVTAIMGH